METNLQTNCYNCSKPLPQLGYFCGGCLTQVKCKSCDSPLEKDDAGCVNCGTPKEVRTDTKTGSHQNINTFRLHETGTGRTIEATFSDDVAKDLAGTLRDAAAGRMRAIASSFPPLNDFSGADEETNDFVEAEVLNNENGVPKIEATHKSALAPNPDTAKPEEYPTLKAVAMKNLPATETEWVVVYSFYSSNYGKDTFTRQNLIEKYDESSRLDSNKKKALSMYIKRAVQGNFINPLADTFSILDNGIEKAKEIISRTSSSSPKSKSSSKAKKGNEDTAIENKVVNGKKVSKPSKTLKRLTNINFEPTGKESLRDFFARYTSTNDNERNLLFVHYLQNVLEIVEISFEHIYSCYDILELRISENLPQTIRNTASKTGWIETNNSILSVTIKGSNQIKAWDRKD